MVAEDVQVAGARRGLIRWCGNLVRVALPALHAGVEQLRQGLGIKAEQVEVEVHRLKVLQLDGQ